MSKKNKFVDQKDVLDGQNKWANNGQYQWVNLDDPTVGQLSRILRSINIELGLGMVKPDD